MYNCTSVGQEYIHERLNRVHNAAFLYSCTSMSNYSSIQYTVYTLILQPVDLKEVGSAPGGGGQHHYGSPGGGGTAGLQQHPFTGFPFLSQLPPGSFFHPALEVEYLKMTDKLAGIELGFFQILKYR